MAGSFDARKKTVVPSPATMLRPWVLLRSVTRHPFIFKRMIRSADEGARPGEVVHVYDKSGMLFGQALYNPRSQIALRMLTYGAERADEAFWRGAIARAVDLRRRLNLDDVTDAYRVIHAEGDGLSGLIAERYADWLVFEFFSRGMYAQREMLARELSAALGAPASLDRPGRAGASWRVVFRADSGVEMAEDFRVGEPRAVEVVGGELKPLAATTGESRGGSSAIIREHGVRYRVDMTGGHKTGFFCDQRDNRLKLSRLCRDANVLDLCCYTAAFGLCARVLGGARDVTSVDLDEAALAVAKENVNLNSARVNLVHSDAFIYLRQLIANGKKFDVVVCDPPKLARSREELDDALRKYYDLNGLSMQVVAPGGILLTCSCSGLVDRPTFRETVERAARPAKRSIQWLDWSGPGADHPVMPNCPESAYLKAAWVRVL
ncbi:MAG: class I SAM-dependent rRNA methyltransferase [Planctomycetia bacterium]|nr:MAG: class I SAM-dependent rRNA methyltransferase [Planctomycetia bacterium]